MQAANLLPALVLADTRGLAGAAQRSRLHRALVTERAVPLRRRPLVDAGLLSSCRSRRTLTSLGREVLSAHADEVSELRRRIEDLLEEEREADLAFAEAMEDRLARGASEVAITGDLLRAHLAHLELPPSLPEQMAAALSAGKHILLAGPPGTGKTEIALGLGAAAAEAGHCRGIFTATASADWSTYETVGGYALERDGALRFRPGVFLAALEQERWLLVDELNRADVDRAFGELLTVLAGRGVETPFQLPDGRRVSLGVGPGARGTHRVPPSFRLIATMNTWDRGALFHLSAALQRRFALIHVGPPDDAGYARLLDRHARTGDAPPLDPVARAVLLRLFSRRGLLAHRPFGPAIALDILRYVRRRGSPGEALAEALGMMLVPQLEGLPGDAAAAVADRLDAELAEVVTPAARADLRARLRELHPDLHEPGG